MLPSISIIIVTLNCENFLEECLRRIGQQAYRKDLVEVIIVDGGSSDNTVSVARGHGCRVIAGGYRENQEARRYIGVRDAKHDIVAFIDSDNFIPHENWLLEMVEPMLDDPEIIATQTWRYGYRKDDQLLNRYFALFGVNDPVVYYLGKMDRLAWSNDRWCLGGEILEEHSHYYTIRFNGQNLPTVGCNGFFIRRQVVEKVLTTPESFFHTDINHDLVMMGYDRFGFVKNEIIHVTGSRLISSLRKRYRYMRVHHQSLHQKRRYKVFDSSRLQDWKNLIKFAVFTLTGVVPVYESVKGYRKIKDSAWFLHWPVCMAFLFVYSSATVWNAFQSKLKATRV